jgi:hypothetical protein
MVKTSIDAMRREGTLLIVELKNGSKLLLPPGHIPTYASPGDEVTIDLSKRGFSKVTIKRRELSQPLIYESEIPDQFIEH